MNETDTTEFDSTAAFEVLGDETRIAVLGALADRMREAPEEPWLSFTDLRERADVRDSGNFSYHLNRLRDRFVRKIDEGYVLTYPGISVTSAIVAGTYDNGSENLGGIDEDCIVCGSPLRANYANGRITVGCENGHRFTDGLPPGAMEGRSMIEAAALSSRLAQQEMELIGESICPLCYGTVAFSAAAIEDHWLEYVFDGTCERCGMYYSNTPGGCVVRHPSVVSFHYDHGIDVRECQYWQLDFCLRTPTILTENPVTLRIEIEHNGEELWVTIDDEATIVETERRRA